ncbi:hypothetical protein B0T18DRAFT_488467 [Schizothecium vesticola]|uniref:Uncharacterized protein n=1 Tax=Schizothecium vesticola TaxID=314040 RepID=A0AA40EUK7_9PEZI|nr:hypothetical protein B0T18DRAFT_488467 [Schizothecium vesticola]
MVVVRWRSKDWLVIVADESDEKRSDFDGDRRGDGPSFKLCQELTLTMPTTRGARPATPRSERRAAAAFRPPGPQPKRGRSPQTRWLINSTPALSSSDPTTMPKSTKYQATGVMLSYPPDKKWALVYQDRLLEWESLLRRQTELAE